MGMAVPVVDCRRTLGMAVWDVDCRRTSNADEGADMGMAFLEPEAEEELDGEELRPFRTFFNDRYCLPLGGSNTCRSCPSCEAPL